MDFKNLENDIEHLNKINTNANYTSRDRYGKPVKFPGIVSPNRVTVQALRDSVKSRDVSVCSIFVKYEHFLSKILPHKWIMKIWLSGIKDYV